MLDRRQVLKLLGATLVLPACGSDAVEVCNQPLDNELDTVLAALHRFDPEFDGGLSNHGPMAAEVLFHVGRSDRLCDWVGGYAGILSSLPAAQPITEAQQASARGDITQRAAWIATQLLLLDAPNPRAAFGEAVAALLPGLAGRSFHGVLRTGHALRALDASPSSTVRAREVAHGLGYWAASYLELPGIVGSAPTAGYDAVQLLNDLSLVENQQSGGFVHERIARITTHAPFADEIAKVDLEVWSFEQTITELCAAAARLYIADGNKGDLGYLHAFDVASILRPLTAGLPAATKRAALAYAVQGVAAVHATHGSKPGVPSDDYRAGDPVTLRNRGALADDEHTIKFVEALLREHAIDPRPEFLVAAAARLG